MSAWDHLKRNLSKTATKCEGGTLREDMRWSNHQVSGELCDQPEEKSPVVSNGSAGIKIY